MWHAAAVCKSLESEVCVALNQVQRIMNWVFFPPEVPPTWEEIGGGDCVKFLAFTSKTGQLHLREREKEVDLVGHVTILL